MAEPAHATHDSARKSPTPSRAPSVPALDADGVDTPVEVDAAGATLVARLADPRLGSPSAAQRARLVQRLQRGYGNTYVSRLVQRAVAAPPEAAPAPQKLDPHKDPKFAAVEQKIGQTAKQEKQHASPKSKVAEAQAAAVGPPNDVASQAAAGQVDKMAQQKPGEFDKKAFVDAVKKAIEAAAPKNLEQADEFKKSDKAGQVKNEVSGMVGKGKQDSAATIKQANTEPPDTSQAKPKPVTQMADEKPGAPPGDPNAGQAIPSPKTSAETSMAAGPAEVNQQMADAQVTDEQLKKSNEPQFTGALDTKKTAEDNSQTAPQDYKAVENQTLAKAGSDAKSAAAAGLSGMHADKANALTGVTGQKGGAKAQDEAKRAEVASKIEAIFNQTRTDVTAILDGLDAKVDAAFDAGEKDARAQFETYVDQKMTAYKDKRYGGATGWTLWLKDKVMDMPSEVNAFYSEGRARYLTQMEGVINKVADVVGGELGKAKKRIADGRQQVKDYVASRPKDLQKVAKDAEAQISSKFDQLEGDVTSKQDSLVQSLADKYVAARDALDDRINQLKAENKGLVSAAKDAIGGVIETIKHLKDMLLNVLQKAQNVIGDIIKDPIKFLGNLVGAVKMGLNQFVANIGTHLKKGLMGWLFGTLGDAGITLPDSFDLKGILSLILQILGLTYENIRAIAVKIAGEKVVAAVEGTVKFFMTLAKEGPAGLWQWIKDKIAELNIKDMVLGAIKDFVITKIITAGVTWLIGLLNPAAAFVKACKMIYDVIMFFIERGSQIMEFVNSILDGMAAIVSGSLGPAANLVESSLAKILPLAISFLASLLGVGGIAEKIKDIIEKIRAPITKLVTAVIGPILKPLKKLYEKGAKWIGGKIAAGKAWAKNKYESGKKWVKNKAAAAKAWAGGKVAAVKQKRQDKKEQKSKTEKVKADALRELSSRAKGITSLDAFSAIRKSVLDKYRAEGLKSLTASMSGGASPSVKFTAKASPGDTVVVNWNSIFVPDDPADPIVAQIEAMKKKFEGTNETTPPDERMAVWAVLSVDGKPVGQMRQNQAGKQHAEEVILANDWNPAVEQAKSLAKGREDPVRVVLTLSASPCSRCSALLSMQLMATRAALPPDLRNRIQFSTVSKGAYEKSEKLSDDEAAAEFEATRQQFFQRLLQSVQLRKNFTQKRLGLGKTVNEFLDIRAEDDRLRTKISLPGMAQYQGFNLPKPTSTKYQDIKKMMAAGWDVQVLQLKDELTDAGKQLETAIKNIRAKFNQGNSG